MQKNIPATAMDAISLLKQDHRAVEALFQEYEAAEDKRTKTNVAHRICAELDVHAKIEEKIFYPTAKRAVDEAEDQINEGIVEHIGIKRLVKELTSMTASDDLFDAKVTCLIEYVKHHVREEEKEMFPKIQQSGDVDLEALGRRLAAEKARLQGIKPSRTAKANGKSPPRGQRTAAASTSRA